jgi:hypothetical protein
MFGVDRGVLAHVYGRDPARAWIVAGRKLRARRRGAHLPVASVLEFDVEPGDRSTTNYDGLAARLRDHNPPKGLILQPAGFTPDSIFRVFAVRHALSPAPPGVFGD